MISILITVLQPLFAGLVQIITVFYQWWLCLRIGAWFFSLWWFYCRLFRRFFCVSRRVLFFRRVKVNIYSSFHRIRENQYLFFNGFARFILFEVLITNFINNWYYRLIEAFLNGAEIFCFDFSLCQYLNEVF